MSTILICPEEKTSAWENEIRKADPKLDLVVWPESVPPESIEYAIVARLPSGCLQPYVNLKAILSTWAGVEGLLSDPTVPKSLPIVRMVEPGLTQGMIEYVCCHVLNIHLRTRLYRGGDWQHPQKTQPRFASGTRVGVLGLGALGLACAKALVQLGFTVSGWSRTTKRVGEIASFSGQEELASFLNQADILVGLLPNTSETLGLLNKANLSELPRGASIINAGRGELINDSDLLAAIKLGHVVEAVLDVFSIEPLPNDHPYRRQSRVTITPHVASVTNPVTATPVLMESLKRLKRGQSVENLVDRSLGY
ncbi:MAG: glyoxylate/hydroxypyruvate reductase A [Parasphingorhabdus sp.]|jgi:glyoxylate/hydroxypyruvate reductase A